MNDDATRAAATRAGLMVTWRDVRGEEQHVAPEVLRHLLDLLPPGPPGVPPLLTADAGAAAPLPLPPGRARLTLEDGSARDLVLEPCEGGALLPAVEAAGYHRLAAGRVEVTLAVAPPRCWTVADACPGRRPWGLAVQVYGLRAPAAALGDFGALRRFAGDAASAGADAVAISPVHAQFAADPQRFSPYTPSSRVHLNVLHADPAAAGCPLPPDPDGGAEAARLEALELVDWPAAARLRLARLRRLFAAFAAHAPAGAQADFAAFRAGGDGAAEQHARFEALHAAMFGADPARWHWRTWPEALRSPQGASRFAAEHAAEVAFHAFAQYLAQRSLAAAQAAARAAGMGVGLIADIAVGVDAGGSDAWASPDELLRGVSIGAPPDIFNALGQSWGVTSFAPAGLVASGYRSFLAMLRAAMGAAGGVRIDHAMGLARLWLVPDGADPAAGCYLRYPAADLLRLVRLESWRHRAVVIGEDLGTLPDGYRERLEAAGIAGMRVLWFERAGGGFIDPRHWSAPAVAMTSTHDLPTLAGWWRGTDLAWRARLDIPGGDDAAGRAHDRGALWNACGGGAEMPATDAAGARRFATAAAAHTARAGCALALLPLEDALAGEEQPNLPGTIDEHPNWRRRYPPDPLRAGDTPERLAAFAHARAEGQA